MTPPRLDTPELLDEHDAPRRDVERSLRDLRRINRWLGGIATYGRLIRRFAPVRSVIDLGAGTADLLESVEAPLRIALDFKIEHLLYLRHSSAVRRVVADARRLPFRDGSVDVATSAHFFHHFGPDENAAIIREAMGVVSKGIAINDTRRHYAPLAFIAVIAALRLVGRITRFDGPASVRRAYTPEEARAIADRAFARRVEVVRLFPFRFGILLWK